jgi:16S rRNA (guanine527-N7)-methyltransferase
MTPGTTSNTTSWTEWRTACQSLGVSVTDLQQTQFEQFYQQLVETNRSVNLTRITALEDFLYRHLLDSLAIAPLIPQQATLADIGSGAGFPAIPLAIARPDLTITAVESIGKKSQFIRTIQESLGLANLTVLTERSETLGHQPSTREQFDCVTARAVATLPVLLELCLPLVKTGGTFLAMKGLSYEAELAAAGPALKTLGGKLKEVKSFPHPTLEGSRLLVIEKIRPTPKQYPRSAGLAAKKPIT